MAGTKGHSGGLRPGGERGRPRKHPPKPPPALRLPWKLIREAAEAGADESEVVRALEISESALGDQAVLARFRDVLAVGRARYLLELRKTIKKRGIRTTKSAGSVNALSLQARNHLDWDKQLPAQETEPDLGTARQRLKDLLVKLAESRSEIERKRVTPLALIEREARAVEEAHARDGT